MYFLFRAVVFTIVSVLFILAFQLNASAAQCEWNKKIWFNEIGNERWVLYFDDLGNSGHWNVFIELWRNKKLAARMHGNYACSNGASIYHLSIVKALKPYVDHESFYQSEGWYQEADVLSTMIVEKVDVTGKMEDEILVTPAFRQRFWNSLNEHVTKFQSFEDDYVFTPHYNYFRYFGCRKNLLEFNEAKAPWAGTWTAGNCSDSSNRTLVATNKRLDADRGNFVCDLVKVRNVESDVFDFEMKCSNAEDGGPYDATATASIFANKLTIVQRTGNSTDTVHDHTWTMRGQYQSCN